MKKLIFPMIFCGLMGGQIQASAPRHYRQLTFKGSTEEIDQVRDNYLNIRPNALIIYAEKKNVTNEWLLGVRKIIESLYPLTIIVEVKTEAEMQAIQRDAFDQVTPEQKLRWDLEAAKARRVVQVQKGN